MTYYELFSEALSEKHLKDMMLDEVRVALFLGNNPDRIKAIEDAGNRVAQERGWTAWLTRN